VDERLPSRPELTPGCEHRDARPNGAANLGNPNRGERADLRSTEPRTGVRDDIAFSNVSAARANVLTGDDSLEDFEAIAVIDHSLDWDDGVSPVRHCATGRDPGGCSHGKRI